MLIRHKKPFNLGLTLAITFVGVLLLIFSPIFGGKNGLEYSDALFNKLSKGSSYFIPDIAKKAEKFTGNNIAVNIKLDKPEMVDKAVKILLASGAQVGAADAELKINGDLGALLDKVLKDSDDMYKNDGAKVSGRYYGYDEKEVMKIWWTMLSKSVKELQKAKKIDEANIINEVMKKAIEPAFNYYHIEAQSVMDKAGIMTALLVFYVAYTMWWGYAIFYLFEGIGLSMKKAKVKKEA